MAALGAAAVVGLGGEAFVASRPVQARQLFERKALWEPESQLTWLEAEAGSTSSAPALRAAAATSGSTWGTAGRMRHAFVAFACAQS